MPDILTTSFKNDVTRLFVDDLLNNDYYLFVSSIDRFNPSNSIFSTNQFLEKTLFAKKIDPDDINFMIKYYPWQRGQVYTQVDDRVNSDGTNFYTVVGPTNNDTGDYRVYKCLFNNYGAAVESPPNYNETTANQIYRTADGYIWKFVYFITELEFEAYNASGYIPITKPFVVDPAVATGSTISDIVVENPEDNTGYTVALGSLILDPFDAPNNTLVVRPFTTFNPITNYYVGQSIYLTNPNGTTRLYEITDYTYSTTTGNAEIRVTGTPKSDGVVRNASFKIFPRIEILGDGTGAVAIPNVVNNSIKTITLLNEGSGYTNVSVRVIDPSFDFFPEDPATSDVRANIRAVLTPRGGHGYNLIDEFMCRHFGLYAYITGEDNNQIGATNTYGAVGIVKNPLFKIAEPPSIFDNRIAIVTDDIDRVTANTVVTQLNSDNDVVFSAVVHEVDLTSNTMYLAEYMGPYVNNTDPDLSDISIDLSLPFRNETGQTIQINTPIENNIITSPYIQRSGRVYFMKDFFPLPRSEASREEFKFVLEF